MEVFLLLESIDCKRSFGNDKIHPLLLSSAALEIFRPVTYIINLSLKKGSFPDSLKIAKVIPIFKQGSRSLCSNYRPISVLSALSKIFERCILNQLIFYCLTENILVYNPPINFRVILLATLRHVVLIAGQLSRNNPRPS